MSKNLMNPKEMMSLLYNHFDDVHQAAISHVVTDENGDHLYLALIRADGKQHAGGATPGHQHRPEKEQTEHTAHTAQTAMPAETSADPVGSVDDLDVSLSRHLVGLLHQPVMWDACSDKQHCGGAGPAHRPRHKHKEPKVPAHQAHHAVEDHAAMENSNPATTVSHSDVDGIFKVMDRVSAYGLQDAPAANLGGAA